MLVVRIIFWTWLAISLSIFLFRGVRWVVRGRARRLATSGVGVAPSGSAPAGTPTSEAPPVPPAPAPMPATDLAPPPEPASSPMAPDRAAEPTAPPVAAPAPPEGRAPTRSEGDDQTIAALVHGIRMPCDLFPLPDAQPRPGAQESIAFATTDARLEEVGEALAAELERLGFRIHPVGQDELLATREGGELKAGLHRRAGSVNYGGTPAFPTTPASAVVVELWRD